MGAGIAACEGMRLLLIFLAVPGIALAQDGSRSSSRIRLKSVTPQVAPLTPPAMLAPGPAGYPLNGQLGSYQLNPQFQTAGWAMTQGMPGAGGAFNPNCPQGVFSPPIPDYLAHFNRGIPCFNGQQASAFNILPYNMNQSQIPQQQRNQSPTSGGGNPLANLFNQMANPNENVRGSPYTGGSTGYDSSGRPDGRPVNSGPDGLCYQAGLFQTTARPELGGLTPCQVIANTIENDSCTSQFTDVLARENIEDMEQFCPGWTQMRGDPVKRTAMLTGLVAAIVRTESGWRNGATGDGGKSKGMLQLTTATDRRHGCSCGQLSDEHNMGQNLRCGTHMIISFMARDKTVGRGTGDYGARGIARSFGPFRDGRGERADIMRRTSNYCRRLQTTTPTENEGAVPIPYAGS